MGLANGDTLHKEIPSQFFKSLSKLEIVIKHKNLEVSTSKSKVLEGNRYLHFKISDVKNNLFEYLANIFVSKIKHFLRRFKIRS